jgi:hypothetical protein
MAYIIFQWIPPQTRNQNMPKIHPSATQLFCQTKKIITWRPLFTKDFAFQDLAIFNL